MIAPPEKTPERRRPITPSHIRDASGLWADIPAFTAFAHEVQQAMVGPDLSYPERLRLLQRANHFGIRRFDANLIIAMVQNRAPSHQEPPSSNRFSRWIAYGAIAILIQYSIIYLAWIILRPVL